MAADAVEYRGETKRRRRWLAVLLTFLCPGLGFMYVGQLLKGVIVNLMFLLMLESFVIVFSIFKFFPLLPGSVVAVSWFVFSGFAARAVLRDMPAGEEDDEYVLKGYNHWTVYGIVFLFSYLVPIYATAHFIGSYLLTFERVETTAMYPTLHPGDTVLVDRSAFRARSPRRGELVAVRSPGGEDLQVLRVVAVENDLVRIEGDDVYVNGEPLERSTLDETAIADAKLREEGDFLALIEENDGNRYVISVSPRAFLAHDMPPTKLSAGEFFVLADNRSQVPREAAETRIRDSRNFGAVEEEVIRGEPLYIAWSEEPENGSVRWDRIGLRTQ